MQIIYRQQRTLIALSLFAIYLFGAFLRYEDFPQWNSMDGVYQYQNEYQMTNFDSYYYLIIARDIFQGDYDTLDELRRVPNGMDRPLIPPLSSWLAATLAKLTELPLPTLAIFFPVILAPLLCFITYRVCRELDIDRGFSLVGAFLAIISYTYVVRSRVGVFDTDCLNVSWVLFNSWLATKVITSKGGIERRYLAGLLSSTALFAIWWNTASIIAISASLAPLGLAVLLKLSGEARCRALSGLALLSLLIMVIYVSDFIELATLILGLQPSTFPLLGSISELEVVDLDRFVKDTAGSALLCIAMVIGLGIAISQNLKKTLYYLIPMGLGFIPLFLGNRFLIFSAPVLAIGGAALAQTAWRLGGKIRKETAAVVCFLLVALSLHHNYIRITDKLNVPAVHENRNLLDLLAQGTEPGSNIWTNWSLGYQINYYLNRGTVADGQLHDGGEILYYLSFPFVTENLKLAANFINFYSHSQIELLYKVFGSRKETFEFLNRTLSKTPKQAEAEISKKIQAGELNGEESLTNTATWLRFLYPKNETPNYLLLHQKMLQTVSWFKQGHIDLDSYELIGLPFYLQFHNLDKKEEFIFNQEIVVNTQMGLAKYRQGSMHSFSSITECQKQNCASQYYSQDGKKISVLKAKKESERFVFQWNREFNFGAAMSGEMATTAFNQLFLQDKRSPNFQLIDTGIPNHQLWKVIGDSYEG